MELEYGINSGIHLRGLANGLVPIQEEHEARLERGISLKNWSHMELMEKALIMAVRRNRTAMQNIQTEAEIRKAERNMKSSRRK